jgi:hypothetical protein
MLLARLFVDLCEAENVFESVAHTIYGEDGEGA